MNNAIGIDLGGTNLKSAIITRTGLVRNLQYHPTEAGKGPKHVIGNLIRAVKDQVKNAGSNDLAGIGVGCAGQVDVRNGIVYDPPNLKNWHKECLKDIIETEFGLPVKIDNDANAAAMAEAAMGAGKESENFILVTLGTGIGAGLILRKKIFHGAIGAAGEFGHTIIDLNGPVCKCGQRGCIERYVGAQWIVERAMERLPSDPGSRLARILEDTGRLTPKIIADSANDGDRLSTQIMVEVGTYLGVALGSVINLLNLDMIIVGGGISKTGPILFDAIQDSLKKHSMSIPRSIVKLRMAEMGENAGVIGAGHMIFDN